MDYPAPLVSGSRIALTAFSSGVEEKYHPRLDLVIDDFKALGFIVVEGQCLRSNLKHVSANKALRAAELMSFLLDDSIDAIAPPWGGELAIELLPLLDYDLISKAKPKWIFGFSDVSTLCVALTTICGWGSVHCANFIDLNAAQGDLLTANTLSYMSTPVGGQLKQLSSKSYQSDFINFEKEVNGTLNLSQPTQWKPLNTNVFPVKMQGRLIGGCLDTIHHLLGTPYFDLMSFGDRFKDQGIVLYFENAELSPVGLIRVLLGMQFKGLFSAIAGLLIGRSSAISVDSAGFGYEEALIGVLSQYDFPVLYDVDIGHMPPNLTLINGSYAEIEFDGLNGSISQSLI